MSKADEVHVLHLDGWEDSRGAIAEIEYAISHNISVFNYKLDGTQVKER